MASENTLPMWVVYERHSKDEGAVLAFAATQHKARKLGLPVLQGYWDGVILRDVKADRMEDDIEHLRSLAISPEPCVVEPSGCSACCMWGQSMINDDGLCTSCADEAAVAAMLARTDRPTPEERAEVLQKAFVEEVEVWDL